MFKRIIAIAAALISIVSLSGFKSGGGTTTPTLAYALSGNTEIQSPVEQETNWPWPADQSQWITNPTGCAFDVDDHWTKTASGTLAAGASLTTTDCVIGSPSAFYRSVNGNWGWWSQSTGFMAVLVTAPSSALNVSMCYTPGQCFTAKPHYVSTDRMYHYAICVNSQFATNDPQLATIPGTQGGIGVQQTVVTKVTNPTSTAVKTLSSTAEAESVGIADGGCQGAVLTTSYPYSYYVG